MERTETFRTTGIGKMKKQLQAKTAKSRTEFRMVQGELGLFDPSEENLIELVVERENMNKAWKKVKANKGSAGVDKMTIADAAVWLRQNWEKVREQLLHGKYFPEAVRRVEIPKKSGGMRKLGIPTVVDRLIQQAMHQILSPIFEPIFSDSSYGFRPGRSAQMAVSQACDYVREGKKWVVDIDLEKFFDCVNHDILMSRVERKIKDNRILLLIRRYLKAGVMVGGLVEAHEEGTMQGGPLSPLLSNIILNDLDRELEKRGHSFCRYADDNNIYVKSKRAGERVMANVTRFLKDKLRLKVNESKSAVARPWTRKFLGYSMTSEKVPRLKVSPESVKKIKGELKALWRMARGNNLDGFICRILNPKLRGWANYYNCCEVKAVFEDLDGWIRRHLRKIIWVHLKKPHARYREMIRRGLGVKTARMSAWNGRGKWWNSDAIHMKIAFPTNFFTSIGLISLLEKIKPLKVT
jgi:RNA-directed DNA polymerase